MFDDMLEFRARKKKLTLLFLLPFTDAEACHKVLKRFNPNPPGEGGWRGVIGAHVDFNL